MTQAAPFTLDLPCGCCGLYKPEPIRVSFTYCPMHAAAPELLEALLAAEELASESVKGTLSTARLNNMANRTSELRRAAIAKATGS